MNAQHEVCVTLANAGKGKNSTTCLHIFLSKSFLYGKEIKLQTANDNKAAVHTRHIFRPLTLLMNFSER